MSVDWWPLPISVAWRSLVWPMLRVSMLSGPACSRQASSSSWLLKWCSEWLQGPGPMIYWQSHASPWHLCLVCKREKQPEKPPPWAIEQEKSKGQIRRPKPRVWSLSLSPLCSYSNVISIVIVINDLKATHALGSVHFYFNSTELCHEAGEFFWMWIQQDQVFARVLERCPGLWTLQRTAMMTARGSRSRHKALPILLQLYFEPRKQNVWKTGLTFAALKLCLNSTYSSRSWLAFCPLRDLFQVRLSVLIFSCAEKYVSISWYAVPHNSGIQIEKTLPYK